MNSPFYAIGLQTETGIDRLYHIDHDTESGEARLNVATEYGHLEARAFEIYPGAHRLTVRYLGPPTTKLPERHDRPKGRQVRVDVTALAETQQVPYAALIGLDDPSKVRRELVKDAVIDGGQMLWWDFVEEGARLPWTPAPGVGPLVAARIMDFYGASEGLSGVKWRDELQSRWSAMGPGNLAAFAMQSGDIFHGPATMGHVQALGRILSGEGDNNRRYDTIGQCVLQYLLNGDDSALIVAWFLAKQHMQSGVVWAAPADITSRSYGGPFGLMHRYEKSRPGSEITGDFAYPSPSHEWDAGVFAVAVLTQDPTLMEWCKLRVAFFNHVTSSDREMKDVWNGRYGPRRAAWFLRNLRAAFQILQVSERPLERFFDHVDVMDLVNRAGAPASPFFDAPVQGDIVQPRMSMLLAGEIFEAAAVTSPGHPFLGRVMLAIEAMRDLFPDGVIAYEWNRATNEDHELADNPHTVAAWCLAAFEAVDPDYARKVYRNAILPHIDRGLRFDDGRYYNTRPKALGTISHLTHDLISRVAQ